MQKLPEVSNRKKGRRMRKEKGDLPTGRTGSFSVRQWSGSDRRIDNTLLIGCRRHAYVFGRGVG